MIRLVADENIPSETIALLKSKGVDVISISEKLRGLKDKDILEEANVANRFLVTFDHDFAQLVFKEKSQTKGIILLMFVPKSPQQIAKRLQQVLSANIAIDNQVITVKEDRIKVTRLT